MVEIGKSFGDEKPEHDQLIVVVLGKPGDRHFIPGQYRFGEHHTYPHEVYRVVGDKVVRVECCTDEARWVAVHYLADGFVRSFDALVEQHNSQGGSNASV